jgi:hypothetical protein
MGVSVLVELDVECGECLGVLLVVPHRERLGVDPLLGRIHRHGGPVHIGPTHEGDVLAEQPQRARHDVPSDVRPEVADVQRAVRIREPAGHDRGRIGGKGPIAHAP